MNLVPLAANLKLFLDGVHDYEEYIHILHFFCASINSWLDVTYIKDNPLAKHNVRVIHTLFIKICLWSKLEYKEENIKYHLIMKTFKRLDGFIK